MPQAELAARLRRPPPLPLPPGAWLLNGVTSSELLPTARARNQSTGWPRKYEAVDRGQAWARKLGSAVTQTVADALDSASTESTTAMMGHTDPGSAVTPLQLVSKWATLPSSVVPTATVNGRAPAKAEIVTLAHPPATGGGVHWTVIVDCSACVSSRTVVLRNSPA